MYYTLWLVIPRGLSTFYRCLLTTMAHEKPHQEKPLSINHRSRDQLFEFRTSFYETISSEFLVQRNFKHTQFSREHWNWRDLNLQPLAPKASAVSSELTWLFILIIFDEGHIMNSPFVAIVPLNALVVRLTFMWSRYQFADLTRLKCLSPCIIIHISLYVLSHIAAWTQGWPLLPALRNSDRFLTIPLNDILWKLIGKTARVRNLMSRNNSYLAHCVVHKSLPIFFITFSYFCSNVYFANNVLHVKK